MPKPVILQGLNSLPQNLNHTQTRGIAGGSGFFIYIMLFTININQCAIIANGYDIDLFDAAIIDFMLKFSHSPKIAVLNENGERFYYFAYGKVIEELPILGIKKDAVYRRFKKLCDAGFLIAHPRNKEMNKPFYAFTGKLFTIVSDTYGFKTVPDAKDAANEQKSDVTYGFKTVPPTVLKPYDNNTMDNNTNSNNTVGLSPSNARAPEVLDFSNKPFTTWTKDDFAASVKAAVAKRKADSSKPNYGREMLTTFFAYWSEPDVKGKMKFQHQKTWQTAGRLVTWESRDNERKTR